MKKPKLKRSSGMFDKNGKEIFEGDKYVEPMGWADGMEAIVGFDADGNNIYGVSDPQIITFDRGTFWCGNTPMHLLYRDSREENKLAGEVIK